METKMVFLIEMDLIQEVEIKKIIRDLFYCSNKEVKKILFANNGRLLKSLLLNREKEKYGILLSYFMFLLIKNKNNLRKSERKILDEIFYEVKKN